MSLFPMELHTDRIPPRGGKGRIVLVGAGPGARDLLTLRAVQRLQEADVVFFDRLVDEDVLELARPDAERVFVGKHVGAHSWPQERINEVIVAAALTGRNVVRLKSGDPGVFGRATEELDAARAHGIEVEIVPGVTAACAAAAALGQSLTERGVSDTLVMATGTGSADNPLPDCVRHASPGTTLAFYMSVGQAARITGAPGPRCSWPPRSQNPANGWGAVDCQTCRTRWRATGSRAARSSLSHGRPRPWRGLWQNWSARLVRPASPASVRHGCAWSGRRLP
jgi:uroporphyrin-III C-methyltransferase/precorrin-2 dehydrogenase/sirohydrochlorin ferrochelatase